MSYHKSFGEMLARRSELTSPEEAELRAHLHECPECREMAIAYSQQPDLLRSIPSVSPPPALRAGVLAGVREVQPRRRWLFRPIFAVAPLATAALVVVGALAFLRHPSNSSHTAQGTGRVHFGPAVRATVSVRHGPGLGRRKNHRRPQRGSQARKHQHPGSQSSQPGGNGPVVAQAYPTPFPGVFAPQAPVNGQHPGASSTHAPVPGAATKPTAFSRVARASSPVRASPARGSGGTVGVPAPPSTGGRGPARPPTPVPARPPVVPPPATNPPPPSPVAAAPATTPQPAPTSSTGPAAAAPTPTPTP